MLRKCIILILMLLLTIGFTGCAEKTPAVTMVEASELQNYAIDSEGGLWFWGTTMGRDQESYTKDLADSLSPVPQKIMENVKDVKAGEFFALILKTDGSLWGWGTYQDTMELINPPEKLMDNVVQISVEGLSLYALDADGVLWDWSHAADSADAIRRPTQVMENVSFVAATDTGALYVDEDGSLWQISKLMGNQKRADDVSMVIASTRLSATINAEGTLWTWDENWELSEIAGGVVKVAVELMGTEPNHDTVMYVTNDHTLWLKGYDIRTGEFNEAPIKVMDDIADISLSSSHVLVVTTDGALFGWGNNATAALADSELVYSQEPVSIVLN